MKRLILLAMCAAAVFAFAPARAENVTVGFGVSSSTYSLTGDFGPSGYLASTEAVCQLSVAPGADGFDVLEAAVAQRCIVSYETQEYLVGVWRIRCINEVCNYGQGGGGIQACTRWGSPNLGGFIASQGSKFVAGYNASFCGHLG